jgi:hypothetical protein
MSKFDPSVAVVIDPPAIVERDTSRAEEIVQNIQKLESGLSTSQFELGFLLAEVKKDDLWASQKCLSFDEFVKKMNFDISPRQVAYLVTIATKSATLGITRAQLIKAKISKIKEIFKLDPNAEHVDESTGNVEVVGEIMKQMVVDAPFKTLAEIKKQVEDIVGKVDPDGKPVKDTVMYRQDQLNIVDRAINLNILQSGDSALDGLTGSDRQIARGKAHERICADYLADPNNHAEQLGTPGIYIDEDGTVFETGEEV